MMHARDITVPTTTPKRRPRRTIWIISAAVATFLIWSAFAPLQIIVRGEGRVVPTMNTQVLQNLEGGIVREVFVVEGDTVEAGQRIVQMDATQFRSAVQELRDQRLALLLRLDRLVAEQSLEGQFVPNPEHAALAPEIAQSELYLFNARRQELTANTQTLQELARLRASEVDLLRPMVERSAVPEIDLIRAEQQFVEAEGNLVTMRTQFERQRSEQYAETLVTLRQVEEQIRARQDQLARTDIVSPVRGIVNRVSVTTVGGVVGSGDPLVEIIPLDQPLRIEGRIDPRDIGFVFAGMPASVKLTAFDFAIYGTLRGHVAHLGADTVVDETQRDPQPYYEVFIDLEATNLEGPDGQVDIRPGMLAVVELEAGERTVLQYLLRPLFRSSEALRER